MTNAGVAIAVVIERLVAAARVILMQRAIAIAIAIVTVTVTGIATAVAIMTVRVVGIVTATGGGTAREHTLTHAHTSGDACALRKHLQTDS